MPNSGQPGDHDDSGYTTMKVPPRPLSARLRAPAPASSARRRSASGPRALLQQLSARVLRAGQHSTVYCQVCVMVVSRAVGQQAW